MALVAFSALGLQPQPHVCHPTQLHRACTRMDEAALIDDKPLTAPARVKRVTLVQPTSIRCALTHGRRVHAGAHFLEQGRAHTRRVQGGRSRTGVR